MRAKFVNLVPFISACSCTRSVVYFLGVLSTIGLPPAPPLSLPEGLPDDDEVEDELPPHDSHNRTVSSERLMGWHNVNPLRAICVMADVFWANFNTHWPFSRSTDA